MINIELTSEQLDNLFQFLERVELRGAEVPAFIEITNKMIEASIPNTEESELND